MSASSPWEQSVALAVSAFAVVAAGDRLIANAQAVEAARVEVVAAIDRAIAEGIPAAEVDQVLARLAAGSASAAGGTPARGSVRR